MKSLYGGLLFLFLNPWAVTSYDVDVAPIEWNGVAAYLVVDKNVVQVKLDDYQKASPGVFQGSYSQTILSLKRNILISQFHQFPDMQA